MERVHWLGRSDEIPSLLKAADVLVLPSLWEGMPNVVLEAMAARRAVVATAVEGSEDLVTPGQTGWLVPPADPAVSHSHAMLVAQPGGGWAVVDLGSANGTYVNGGGTPIAENVPVPIGDGDRIHVGAWSTLTLRAN